jgi:hypothetical protein
MSDALTILNTDRVCPGCDQKITVIGEGTDWYSECGGEGEGGCDVWIDGDPGTEAAHEAAIAFASS